MSLVWITSALSSLRRARRCHACRCRGLLPNINGRAGGQRVGCTAGIGTNSTPVPYGPLHKAGEFEGCGQHDRKPSRWTRGVMLGVGSGTKDRRPTFATERRLPVSVSLVVGNKQRSLQTAKRLAAVPPDLRLDLGHCAVRTRDHIDADAQVPTDKTKFSILLLISAIQIVPTIVICLFS